MLLSLPALNPSRAAPACIRACLYQSLPVSEPACIRVAPTCSIDARERGGRVADGDNGVESFRKGGKGVHREVARLSEDTAIFIQNDVYVGGFCVFGGWISSQT